jgi:hypothetical protein
VEKQPEEFVTLVDKLVYGTLADPFTPEHVKDVNDLEKKRHDVLKEEKRVDKLAMLR